MNYYISKFSYSYSLFHQLSPPSCTLCCCSPWWCPPGTGWRCGLTDCTGSPSSVCEETGVLCHLPDVAGQVLVEGVAAHHLLCDDVVQEHHGQLCNTYHS